MPVRTDAPGIVVPPPVVFLLGFLAGMGLDAVLELQRFALPGFVGPTLIVLGAALGLWGAATFRRHRTGILPHQAAVTVVTTGPYRLTRNPMYLGLATVYVGTAILLGRVGPLLLMLPTIAALHRLVIAREERYLAIKFGDEYRRYRQRVRRWL